VSDNFDNLIYFWIKKFLSVEEDSPVFSSLCVCLSVRHSRVNVCPWLGTKLTPLHVYVLLQFDLGGSNALGKDVDLPHNWWNSAYGSDILTPSIKIFAYHFMEQSSCWEADSSSASQGSPVFKRWCFIAAIGRFLIAVIIIVYWRNGIHTGISLSEWIQALWSGRRQCLSRGVPQIFCCCRTPKLLIFRISRLNTSRLRWVIIPLALKCSKCTSLTLSCFHLSSVFVHLF
jgi:hypothetical protein